MAYLIATPHPAAILHAGEGGAGKALGGKNPGALLVPIACDLRRAWRIARAGPDWQEHVSFNPRPDRLAALAASWREAGEVVAIDVETDGLDTDRCRLRCIGLGTRHEAVVVAWGEEAPEEVWAWIDEARDLVRGIVADPGLSKVGHNIMAFDRPVLERCVGPVGGLRGDTMLLHNAIYPDEDQGLGWVAAKYLDVPPWKMRHDRFADTFGPDLWRYNARDVLVTARLWPILCEEAEEARVVESYRQDLEMARIAGEIGRRGVPISLGALDGLWRDLDRAIVESLDRFRSEAARELGRFDWDRPQRVRCGGCGGVGHLPARKGTKVCRPCRGRGWRLDRGLELLLEAPQDGGMNPASPVQLGALLYDVGGLVPKRRSKKGTLRATDEESLMDSAEVPLVAALLDHRGAAKLRESFLDLSPEPVEAVPGWGRLRVSYRVGLVSGRWSSRPYVQAWPERVRGIVRARPGWRLVVVDFAQLELRIMAVCAGARALVRAFLDGRDLHTDRAARVFGQAWHQSDKDGRKALRDATKNVVYAGLYGGTDETVWRTARRQSGIVWITREHVARTLRDFDREYPEVAAFRFRMHARALRDGELRSPTSGRRRIFPWRGRIDRTICANYPIQSGAADVMNAAIVRLEERLRAACPRAWPPWLQQHDSVGLEVPLADVEEVVRVACEAMTGEIAVAGGGVLPLPVEAKIMEVWR